MSIAYFVGHLTVKNTEKSGIPGTVYITIRGRIPLVEMSVEYTVPGIPQLNILSLNTRNTPCGSRPAPNP